MIASNKIVELKHTTTFALVKSLCASCSSSKLQLLGSSFGKLFLE